MEQATWMDLESCTVKVALVDSWEAGQDKHPGTAQHGFQ